LLSDVIAKMAENGIVVKEVFLESQNGDEYIVRVIVRLDAEADLITDVTNCVRDDK